MPLFHDPDRRRHSPGPDGHCEIEQSALGSSWDRMAIHSHHGLDGPGSAGLDLEQLSSGHRSAKFWTNNRRELIQRIKGSSTWRLPDTSQKSSNSDVSMSRTTPEEPRSEEPTAEHGSENRGYLQMPEELGSPVDIRRPRSALHSGDFREGDDSSTQHAPPSPRPRFAQRTPTSPFPGLGISPPTPWLGASAIQPPTQRPALEDYRELVTHQSRSRAPSLGSFSSSYVLKVPTSPLVHQANNTDLDFSPRVDSGDPLGIIDKTNRRRTLPPGSFRQLQHSPPTLRDVGTHNPSQPGHHESFFQPQHFPRRSLTSAYSLQLAQTGNAPAYHARRPSFASELSARPHAPMVGSYEESLLRGRMSMSPSKPLDFTAQIGVLGKGQCKGRLKCPPHVTVPFPAFFYSYPTSGNGRSIADDSPSPYVGHIDLENSLAKGESNTTRRRKRHVSPTKGHDDAETGTAQIGDVDTRRRREKKNRRAESPKCPPGGCYRIPQQGQLQIIIKNPHKTAVKLFLVPYDLTDMEPGTKTFIRQRSYSAGPIIDMPLSARKNYGTDRPEASLNATEDPRDKPVLRYLIHVNICCPARGRFYLHSTVRVVFANRVPDGKEKLLNEIQLPDPRYSPYKPARDSSLSRSTNARLAIEGVSRRRSVGQGTIPLLRPHVSSPSDVPLHWTAAEAMGFTPNPRLSADNDSTVYNKLNKGDVGYGGSPYSSSNGGSENGESLLAKRLRGLDVHKKETFDSN